MSRWPWLSFAPKSGRLRAPIERHLGTNLADAQSIAHEIKPIERIGLQQVVDGWVRESQPPAQMFGYCATGYVFDDELMRHLLTNHIIQAPMEWVRVDSGPSESMECTERGLFLIHRNKQSIVLAFRAERIRLGLVILEVIAATRSVVQDALAALLDQARRGEATTPMRLRDGDIQEAIHELVYFSGELTQKLLGYRTGRLGFRGPERNTGAPSASAE